MIKLRVENSKEETTRENCRRSDTKVQLEKMNKFNGQALTPGQVTDIFTDNLQPLADFFLITKNISRESGEVSICRNSYTCPKCKKIRKEKCQVLTYYDPILCWITRPAEEGKI